MLTDNLSTLSVWSIDGSRLSRVEHGALVRTYFARDSHYFLRFDEDTRSMAIHSVPDQTRLGELDGALPDVAFSPDGKRLATQGDNGNIKIWDATAFTLASEWRDSLSQTLAWSRSGRYLAAAGADHVLRLFYFSRDDLIGALCQLLTRDLKEAEWSELRLNVPFRAACPKMP